LYDRRAGRADARLGAQLGLGCIAQTAQIPQPGQQILSDLQGILSGTAAAQKKREKLGIG
jgi:hypothetical protein